MSSLNRSGECNRSLGAEGKESDPKVHCDRKPRWFCELGCGVVMQARLSLKVA